MRFLLGNLQIVYQAGENTTSGEAAMARVKVLGTGSHPSDDWTAWHLVEMVNGLHQPLHKTRLDEKIK
jgi:hypothetical protein